MLMQLASYACAITNNLSIAGAGAHLASYARAISSYLSIASFAAQPASYTCNFTNTFQ